MGFSVKYNEKRNKWIWRARVTINSKQYEKSGSADKQQDAELEGSQVYAKLVRDKATEVSVTDRNITIEDLILEWFNTCKRGMLSPKSIVTYEGNINNHIIPNIGFIQVSRLNRVMYQKFINSLVAQKYAKGSISLINSLVVSCLDFAMRDLRIIDFNPASKINIPIKNKPTKKDESNKFYTDKELESMYDAAEFLTAKTPDKALAGLLFFLANTGLRISEALGLQESDYIEAERKLIIDKQLSTFSTLDKPILSPPKTSMSEREIYLDKPTHDLLKKIILSNKEFRFKHPELKRPHNFLFNIQGEHIYREKFRKFLIKVCNLAEVDYHHKHSVHAFRHTHVKKLVESGVPEISIQQRIGHSKHSAVTKSYMHSDDNMAKKAIEQYEKYMSM